LELTLRAAAHALRRLARWCLVIGQVHLNYLGVLNLKNESRNFLTNWFQWTEKYRASATKGGA